MSAVATALPARRPAREQQPRHIDIAPTRSQKKARPRAVYALVTVAGLFAILLAQLLLSIVVSDGAYQISGLQQEQKELARDRQALTEQLQVLESPQHLAANAEALGMVASAGTAYLRLADGAVLGAPVAARTSDGIAAGPDGAPLVPNELLQNVAITAVSAVTATGADTSTGTDMGAPGTLPAGGSVASTPQGLPSPITR